MKSTFEILHDLYEESHLFHMIFFKIYYYIVHNLLLLDGFKSYIFI